MDEINFVIASAIKISLPSQCVLDMHKYFNISIRNIKKKNEYKIKKEREKTFVPNIGVSFQRASFVSVVTLQHLRRSQCK